VLGWLADTLDFFLVSGWKGYFLERRKRYGSSVFKSSMLMRSIAILDSRGFEPLVNWDGRLRKEYGFGWAKPPPALVGGTVPGIFAGGLAHSAPKTFYMELLRARAGRLASSFDVTAREYLARWERGAPFSWRDEIERFYATFFFQWLIGLRPDPEDVRTVFNDLFSHVFWPVTQFLPWSKYSRALRAYARLRYMLKGLPGFEEACEIAQGRGMNGKEEIASQLLFTIGVNCYLGLQNLSKSVAGELSVRPALAVKLREEVVAGLGRSGPADLDRLQALPLLDRFVNETLRLHPPVFFIFGRAEKEFVLETGTGRYRIERGSMLLGVIPIAQRDPACYASPDDFRPERFGDAAALAPLVWPHGPHVGPIAAESRICAGRDFGVLLGKLFAATLVRGHAWTLQDPDVRWNERFFTLNVAAPAGPLGVSRFARAD
jgi:cytochrome P450